MLEINLYILLPMLQRLNSLPTVYICNPTIPQPAGRCLVTMALDHSLPRLPEGMVAFQTREGAPLILPP